MAAVRLDGITKRWGDFIAVDDQSLDVADAEFLVLLGPSGCGKTTTMRMIAGLEEPTAGDIYIGETRVNEALPKDRDIAMVFQNYGLYPHMSVRDNIGYPLKVRGTARADIGPRVDAVAAKVELDALLDRRPRELSGGQRQRVALARAIVRTPQVFLMDEPLSNLDAKLRVSMRAELKHLHHELRITTVYVTHDQVEAMTLADRVAVMNGGRIQQLGTPEQIYDDPANLFVAGFIGSPAMNLVRGTVAESRFETAEGMSVAGIAAGAPGGHAVTLGVRSEDLAVTPSGEGHFDGAVYASELLGDCTLVTVEVGDQRLAVRADRRERPTIGEPVGVRVDPARTFLFDSGSGARIAR